VVRDGGRGAFLCPKRLDPGVVRFHGRDWPASYVPCSTMVGAFVLPSPLDLFDLSAPPDLVLLRPDSDKGRDAARNARRSPGSWRGMPDASA
jgi:hypothetical protein